MATTASRFVSAPSHEMTRAVAKGPSMAFGQFDDAEDDPSSIQKFNSQVCQIDYEGTTVQLSSTAVVAEEAKTTENKNMGNDSDERFTDEYDDDYDSDEDIDYDDLAASASANKSFFVDLQQTAKSCSASTSASHRVWNSVNKMQQMEEQAKRTLTCGRDDRATSEQVMDPRTRLILFKLISSGVLDSLQGCVSAGKEANVYYALAGKQTVNLIMNNNKSNKTSTYRPMAPETITISECAVKVYKTSILVFRDRDKYVAGEHRWRNNYCKSNPRKMVNLWAEKEMRNYKRIFQAGIPCPQPILLKGHVLVMEFLGRQQQEQQHAQTGDDAKTEDAPVSTTDWQPSPRLKDAKLSEKRLREAYIQCVLILRHMYQRCKLVHGDFSEYNLLWHKSSVYVIDVSQSVELHHPSALDFLRADISNINNFFESHKVAKLSVMSTRQLFDFVTSNSVEDEHEELDRLIDEVEQRMATLAACPPDERRRLQQQSEVEEAVFMSRFLPKSLNQVADYSLEQFHQQHQKQQIPGKNKSSPTTDAIDEGLARDIADLLSSPQITSATLSTSDKRESALKSNGGSSSSKNKGKKKQKKEGEIIDTSDSHESKIVEMQGDLVAGQKEKVEVGGDVVIPAESVEVGKDRRVTFQANKSDRKENEVVLGDDHSLSEASENDMDDDDDDDDSDDDSIEGGDEQMKGGRRRTPEELEAEKAARREERRANKKAVREANVEKRQNKLKKKDKRKSIKKAKAGKKKK